MHLYIQAYLFGFTPYIIAGNGAVLRDTSNKEIYKNTLDLKSSIKIIEICRKYQSYYQFFTDDAVYTPDIESKFQNYLEWNKLFDDKPIAVKELQNPKKTVEELSNDIIKFVIHNDNQNYIRDMRIELSHIHNVEITSSHKDNIEIVNKGINKGKALKFLSEYLKIYREDVVAIGDNENDIEMIEYAGLGVSMGNAIDLLKEKSDFVTKSNREHGVEYAIRKFIMN